MGLATAALSAACRPGSAAPWPLLDVTEQAAGPNVLARRFDVEDADGAEVRCTASDDASDVLAAWGAAGEVVVRGFRPDVRYRCLALAGHRLGVVDVEVPAPAVPPAFDVSGDVAEAGVWTAFVPYTAEPRFAWVMDAELRPRAAIPLAPDPAATAIWGGSSVGVYAEPAADGLLIGGGTTLPPTIFDPLGQVVAELALPAGEASHDAVYDGGSVVAIGWALDDAGRITFAVQQVDVATGGAAFVWRAVDAEASGELDAPGPVDARGTPTAWRWSTTARSG